MNELEYFQKYLFEAPGDPPDNLDEGGGGMPDIPDAPEMPSMDDNGGGDDDGMPDVPDAPEMPDFGGEDGFGGDDSDDTGNDDNEDDDKKNKKIEGLDNKVSAILNKPLYQRFLSLLNTIATQLTSIKNNTDIFRSINSESLDIVGSLETLDSNIRLYLKNSFMNENYSKNLLFFNKCLNLLKMLTDVFTKAVRKGINNKE